MHAVSMRPHEIIRRDTNGRVIVDNRDHRRFGQSSLDFTSNGSPSWRRHAAECATKPDSSIIHRLGRYCRSRRNPQHFGHPHQIGQRLRVHLSHHMSTMDLHGNFADAQFGSNLLVHQAGGDEGDDFPLARGQGFELEVAAAEQPFHRRAVSDPAQALWSRRPTCLDRGMAWSGSRRLQLSSPEPTSGISP